MVDVESLLSRIESTSSMVENLWKTFGELEAHRDASLNCKLQFEELQQHFLSIECTLKKRLDELANKEKEFEAKAARTQESLKQREAAVVAIEQASLDRLQALRDAAAAEIGEACNKYKPSPSPKPVDADESFGRKVNNYSSGESNASLSGAEENLPDTPGESGPAEIFEVKPCPELIQLCKEMDAIGLLNFISDNRKVLSAIREEVPVALKSATNPAQLVLDSLEGFYPPGKTTLAGDKRDGALLGLRKSCILLLESLTPLSSGTVPDADHLVITPEIKQQAKAIADEWKPKLAELDADAANGTSLEVQAFLQPLATFNISSDFDEDELCKLVLAISRRKQTPELCHVLGLVHKMPGVIESLIDTGKHIDAVSYVYPFKLTESFPPVPLLKAYLKDIRRASQGKGANAGPCSAQNDVNAKALAALTSIMRCVEEHKLESEYPLDPLQKRAAQLERAKADRKRTGEAARSQPKRSRANFGGHTHWKGMGSVNGVADAINRASYNSYYNAGLDNRYTYPASSAYTTTSTYNYPAQSGYNTMTETCYGQQSSHLRSYPYQEAVAAQTSTASHAVTTPIYNGAYLGSGLQQYSHLAPTYL